ncbi:MAG: DNA primase [Endomicrobium sp.]|jgi:DNA primase|nr:DNA primase [Endomicrobium sp.]
MTISEDIIENIRLSNNIESVIKEYLPDIKRIGRNWKACCPFHDEKTPSFLVSPEKGIFKCFGCNVGGDIFKFVMLADNISWYESVKKLAKRANIEIKEIRRQDVIKVSEKTRIFDILESSAMFYYKCLLKSSYAEKARKYLGERGVIRETIDKFRLGYAPKGGILKFALKKGHKVEDLLKAGVITKTEKGNFFEYMSERVVFPIFDVQGRVIAFGGRTIFNHDPKYLNTPETVVYFKSSNLYGMYQTLSTIRKERRIIVLEGYMDVVISQQFGVAGAVATLGTAFNQIHAKLILRYSDSVTLLFDSDEAGKVATQKSLEILVENAVECNVSTLPKHVDADEYINKYGKENFLDLLKNSSESPINFMIKLYSDLFSRSEKLTPEKKAKIVSYLLNFIARSPNLILQREWMKNVAQYMDVNEEIIWSEFKRKHELNSENKNYSQYHNAMVPLHITKDRRFSMSLEESLLSIILNNRSYIGKLDCDCFENVKCKEVFDLVGSGLSDVEILNALSEEYKSWFLELILNVVEYSNVGEAIDTILKDIGTGKLKRKRQQLEKEILLMSEGKKEKNERILYEYKKLTSLLKGSGK